MSLALVLAGAVAATFAVLALAVWLIGRAEDRHEASVREAMRQAGPPVLDEPHRPRHLRGRRWT